MKIVAASDSFKGSLTSLEVAEYVELGVHDVFPCGEVIKLCVADGGEGTVDALYSNLSGKTISIQVSDPLGRKIQASYFMTTDGHTAVVEMSAASGLPLLDPSEYNPMKTSTYGTGELISDALSRGCRRFLVGIGGSATNDAGISISPTISIFRLADDFLNSVIQHTIRIIPDIAINGAEYAHTS